MSNKTSVKSQIAILEKRLAKGDLPAREFAEVTRTLAQLTGAIETYKRKSKPQSTSSGHLPQTCFQGFWWTQIVKYFAGMPVIGLACPWSQFVGWLSKEERKQAEAEAKRILAMSSEELTEWEDEEIRNHPLPEIRHSQPIEAVKPVADESAERAQLMAQLLPKTADIVPPEELPSTATAPASTYSAEHMNEFYEFYKSL